MRCLFIWLFPLLAMLTACHSHSHKIASQGVESGRFLTNPSHMTPLATGDYSDDPKAIAFINRMVNKHHIDPDILTSWIGQAKKLDSVINLMDRQAPTSLKSPVKPRPNGAWLRYRKKFITSSNIQFGVAFWNQYQNALLRAEQIYGVPPEIIIGIMGVETRWGRVMGKTRIIDALATLAFSYPRRSAFFTNELETYLLMAYKEQKDPLKLRGSFAGAMGYGQFMPSAYQNYAVDFSGDGRIDLWDPVDAIGSIAHYFQKHGWQPNQPVAVVAKGTNSGLANGFNTAYTLAQLRDAGLRPLNPISINHTVSLLRMDMGRHYQYWFGFNNFYTITRYNNNVYYAMAVLQLGETVKASRQNNIW